MKKTLRLFPETESAPESRATEPRATEPANSAPEPSSDLTDWLFIERILSDSLVRTVYLWGPPGIGKTHAALSCGDVRNVVPVTLTEDTATAELRGFYRPSGKDVVWGDGPVTRAMREGSRLVLNEISHSNAETFTFLHPILEHVETACVALPTGEVVRPAPGFQVIATDNHPPEDLPFALRDRFDCILEVQDPHPAALERLSPHLRRAAQRSSKLEAERRVGLRGWLSVQRLEPTFGLRDACRATFGPARGALIYDALRLGQA